MNKMKLVQDAYDYSKKIVKKASVTNSLIGFALLILTIAVVHQTSRIHELEKGSLEAKLLLSKRSVPAKVVLTKSDVPAGAIYTRWGRRTCPTHLSKLVYHGVVGGQHFSHTGGGSNILCLTMEPSWSNYSAKDLNGQYIYGGEYQISEYSHIKPTGLFSDANSKTLHDHNVPCAVCQTLTPATTMMIPGRKTCYPGWTIEYAGYLMSGHFKHKGKNEFTCMDFAPESDTAGFRNEDGTLFYHVRGACGSLPCPPYIQARELTCVVCSQRHRTHVHKFGFNNTTKELEELA